VLLKPYVCDTLLSIAEAGAYRPLWSLHVMTELERNLTRRGMDEKKIAHRLGHMNEAFPDALVTGYEPLIPSMINHHVPSGSGRWRRADYELDCFVERPLFSGKFQPWGAASIQVITAPSASHAAQMGSSPQPTAGPGLGKVVPSVGTTEPLPSSHLNAAM
jgi:hypothetical protein